MLHNKLPSCYCAGLTLLQHPYSILTMDNVKSQTVPVSQVCRPHSVDLISFACSSLSILLKHAMKSHILPYFTGIIATKQHKGNIPRLYVICIFSLLLYLCRCFHLSGLGWRAAIRPADHPVANFEFDVVVGADGRRNTLEGEKPANKRVEQHR